MKQTDFASAGQNSKHRVLPPAGPIEGIDKIIDISYAECVSAQWPYTQWVTDVNYSFDLQQGLSFSHWVVDWTIWQWKHYKHLFTWYIGQQSKNAVEWRLFSISHCPPTPIWTIQQWWIVQLTLSLSLWNHWLMNLCFLSSSDRLSWYPVAGSTFWSFFKCIWIMHYSVNHQPPGFSAICLHRPELLTLPN